MARRFQRPPPRLLLTEVFRALVERRQGRRYIENFRPVVAGDGHPVMVIPGFLSTDDACVSLRGFIRKIGYTAYPWGLGRNIGDLSEVTALQARIADIARSHHQPVSLIGWSLGGIYAREAARDLGESVRQVITLGSPFGDVLNSGYVAWVYELMKSEKAKRANDGRLKHTSDPVPVRSTALFSRVDGVVAWQACQEPEEDQLRRNIEVRSSHLGMSFNIQTLQAVASQLAPDPSTNHPPSAS
ncbi:MAG: alpha/beta fold hydrolase [Burkholderiaceae bacterium]